MVPPAESADRTVLSHCPEVEGIGFGEPDMPIDASAFIKPSVAETGIDAGHNIILCAVAQEIGDVELERRIAVIVAPDKATIYEDEDTAESPVEVDRDSATQIACRDLELAAIPAHTGFRVTTSERFESVRILNLVVDKWQFHGPVMGRFNSRHLESSNFALAKAKSPVLAKSPDQFQIPGP